MNESITNEERYGREIFEAICYSNEFPVTKKKLLNSFEKLITDLYKVIEKDELDDYIKAKKIIQKYSEDEIEDLCFSVANLYEDIENYF